MSKSLDHAGLLFHIVESAAKHGGTFANIQALAQLELRQMNDEARVELAKLREEEALRIVEAEAKAQAEREAMAKERQEEEARQAEIALAKSSAVTTTSTQNPKFAPVVKAEPFEPEVERRI